MIRKTRTKGRVLKAILATLGALALTFGLSLPASAAGLDKALVPGDETNTYVRQTATVTDAGGQDFSVSVLWTETYVTAAGNFRVGVKVSANALGTDLDNDGPGDGGIDASVKTYQGYADGHTKKIQDRVFDGTSDPFTFDNANPLNRPAGSKVVIRVGTNDDGFANSPAATFVQPVIGDEDPGADGEGVEGP
jgi:hypothetical protein